MSKTRIVPQDTEDIASDAELAAHAAIDPGDIADPSLATAEDVAEKLNDLMAAMRTAGLLT